MECKNCKVKNWIYCGKDNNKAKVCWKDHNFKIILIGKNITHKHQIPNLEELAPNLKFKIADVIVQEWEEIWINVECDQENKKGIEIYFGEEKAQEKPNGWWVYTFKNYLGKSFIRIKFKNGQEFKTDPIEVISSKTSLNKNGGKLYYPEFLEALINDLIKYFVSAPFELGSPTEFSTEEHAQAPPLIFVLHILAQNADNIIQALQTVWNNPYRKLTTEERCVLLNEATNINTDTLIMMLHHPEYLHKGYSKKSLEYLAKKLKGYVPEKVFEQNVVETIDNPENRFIKRFMDIILYLCDELKRLNLWEKAKSHQSNLEKLEGYVRYLQTDPLFADVGEMTIFPTSSQVLLKRDGYRECLKIYRLLNIARVPIFNRLQDVIDNRRIDILYEYWCFFELSKKLAEIITKDKSYPRFKIYDPTGTGLPHEAEAKLGNGYKLIYNKTFKEKKESYSVTLCPDFSLMHNNKLEVVFDAKFRFDIKEIENLDQEETIHKRDFERLAKIEDIYKMHTYRDALKDCRIAVVLFPGEEGQIYPYDNILSPYPVKKENVSEALEKIISSNWEGVGALPMGPDM